MCIESKVRETTTLEVPTQKRPEVSLDLDDVLSIYIFDWDDTIFPTTALLAFGEEKMRCKMVEIDDVASQLLTCALNANNSHVMLLTNANLTWLHQSAEDFLPKVHAILAARHANLSIVSAYQPRKEDKDADAAAQLEVLFRKVTVAHGEVPRFQQMLASAGLRRFQVVSVGDGPQDLEAGRALATALSADERYLKTVAMKPRPLDGELIGELRALGKALPQLSRIGRSMHQSMYRSAPAGAALNTPTPMRSRQQVPTVPLFCTS